MAPVEAMSGAGAGLVETLIFVDVDGVLNIAVADSGRAPVMFTKKNVATGFAFVGKGMEIAEKVVATYTRETSGGQGETCADLVADNAAGFSELLAARLAELVEASGERRRVVLSSSWRKASHQAQVRDLEESLSRHLGREFAFDASTALDDRESCPADRLRTIGNFIVDHCASTNLRVLVLDDFFVSPMDAWDCDGFTGKSPADAERYLRHRGAVHAGISVKVVHTYDEWTGPSGLPVRIGAGLTREHLRGAHAFLASGAAAGPAGTSFEAQCPGREQPQQSLEHGQRSCFSSTESLQSLGLELPRQSQLSTPSKGNVLPPRVHRA